MGFFNQLKDKIFGKKPEPSRFSLVFPMWLLFEETPDLMTVSQEAAILKDAFGMVELSDMGSDDMHIFRLTSLSAELGQTELPTAISLGEFKPMEEDGWQDEARLPEEEREEAEALRSLCTCQRMVSNLMNHMDATNKCQFLVQFLEEMVRMHPSCKAIWIPSSGHMVDADVVRQAEGSVEERFFLYFFHLRCCHVEGTGDYLLDTLGMEVLNLPDLQYHFHGIDPEVLSNHAASVASWIIETEAQKIHSGDRLDGIQDGHLSHDVSWSCQFEESMRGPKRVLLDICPGEYAAKR